MLEAQPILNKVGSDFKGISPAGVDIENLKDACPTCGSDLICCYSELGTTDYVDCFNHICRSPECGYLVKKDLFDIGMGTRENSGANGCPFCGRQI